VGAYTCLDEAILSSDVAELCRSGKVVGQSICVVLQLGQNGWMRTTRLLGRDPNFGVYEVFCEAPAGPLLEPEATTGFTPVLPQRGRFIREVNGTEYLLDDSTGYFELPGQEQRVGHPCDGGNTCTVVTVSAESCAMRSTLPRYRSVLSCLRRRSLSITAQP
jgi:hypothetical protein